MLLNVITAISSQRYSVYKKICSLDKLLLQQQPPGFERKENRFKNAGCSQNLRRDDKFIPLDTPCQSLTFHHKLKRLHSATSRKQGQSEAQVNEEAAQSRKEITTKEVNLVAVNVYYSSTVMYYLKRADKYNV